MSATFRPGHARPRLPQRIASLFRYDASRPQRPAAIVGMRETGVPAPAGSATASAGERPAWVTRFGPPPDGCPVCSDLEYGVRCTCREDCGHSLCLGDAEADEALASMREQIAEVAPPSFTVVSEKLLQDVLKGLRTLDEPEPPAYVPDFMADYRDLPHFRATLRVRGWCGLATVIRAGAAPDFGLNEVAA